MLPGLARARSSEEFGAPLDVDTLGLLGGDIVCAVIIAVVKLGNRGVLRFFVWVDACRLPLVV